MQVSTRRDDKEVNFIDEVLTMKFDDPRLDMVPRRFLMLDRALRPELEKSCEKEKELMNEMRWPHWLVSR